MNYSLLDEAKAKCLECGEQIYGRPDKKFCCSECKNRFNNRINNPSSAFRLKITRKLGHNYEILSSLLKAKRSCAYFEELMLDGFDPSVFTGIRPNGKGHKEFCCFDITYCKSSSRIFNIRK